MLFSVELLPKVPALRRKIYRDALDSGIEIIFGAEDVVLTGERDIDRVEGLLQCAGKNERQGISQSSSMVHAG
jgi:hypothetical protein